ncbi:hypothetical protein TcWFU_007896 [Taenia crassiceps]|uniref:Uncharacterized protein n=1 Tax=Taenia crassiceps TaxID=6207 RepID=A0ABR4QHR5_9CEST
MRRVAEVTGIHTDESMEEVYESSMWLEDGIQHPSSFPSFFPSSCNPFLLIFFLLFFDFVTVDDILASATCDHLV